MVAELEYVVKTTKFSIERKNLDINDYPLALELPDETAFDIKNLTQQKYNFEKKITVYANRGLAASGIQVFNSNAFFNVARSDTVTLLTKTITIPVKVSYDDSASLIEDSEFQFFKKTSLNFNTFVSGEAIYTTPGTYTWTCPENVTSVNVVCIGAGGVGLQNSDRNGEDSWFIDSTSLNGGGGWGWNLQFGPSSGRAGTSTGTLRTGGFGGGTATSPSPGGNGVSGGGGAGGYTQAGGNGSTSTNGGSFGSGGGVGIYGGTVGGEGGRQNAGGAGGSGGTAGTMSVGGLYGGGGPSGPNSSGHAGGGGGLAYGNNISVTPGNTYNLKVGLGGVSGLGGNGAVRIIWGGPSVSFPSNASASAVDNTVTFQDLGIDTEYLYFKEQNATDFFATTIVTSKTIDLPQTISNSEASITTNSQVNVPSTFVANQNKIEVIKDTSSFIMTTFVPSVISIGVANKIKWGFFITDGVPQYSAITNENDPNRVVSAPSSGPVQIWY